jgi:hypothetical protein
VGSFVDGFHCSSPSRNGRDWMGWQLGVPAEIGAWHRATIGLAGQAGNRFYFPGYFP